MSNLLSLLVVISYSCNSKSNYYFVVTLMASLWSPSNTAESKWKIPNPFEPYQKIYNRIQENLGALSGLDELLSGTYVCQYSYGTSQNKVPVAFL